MIYVTGDTHGAFDINKINPRDYEMMRMLKEGDYLIICGDFGCIWDNGSSDRFWLNWLESLPWTTVFVDGNHENFDALNRFPVEEWHGGKVHKIRSNIMHLMRGEVFDIDGKLFFAYGGAPSHDAAYRREGKTWWKEELPNKSEFENALKNLNKVNWKVDYVLSHDVYASHPLAKKYPLDLSLYDKDTLDLHESLEEIKNKLEYSQWFSGHYHRDCVHFDNNKPTFTLFNKVLNLSDIKINEFPEI